MLWLHMRSEKMVIFGVPAVVTFCSGAFVLRGTGILQTVWAFSRLQWMGCHTGAWALILGSTEFVHVLPKYIFIACVHILSWELCIEKFFCALHVAFFETWPNF